MLRTPASLIVESHTIFSNTIFFGLTLILFLAAVTTAFIGFRRLKIADIWSKNLLHNGRPVNEILHAVGQMMFPIKATLGGILVVFIYAGTLLDRSLLSVIVNTAALCSALILFSLLNREQKLVQQLRTIDPKQAKAGYTSFRMFAGHMLGALLGMVAALVLESLRTAYLPIPFLDGSLTKLLEFCFYVVGIQLFIAPVMLRMMLPSHKPASTEEKQTETVIHEAFNKLGLRQPQVRILALNKLKTNNALIAGLNFAPFPFRQIVMISQDPDLDLSADETRAIIHHELAHGVLWHIPIRVIASIAIWLFGLFALFTVDLMFFRAEQGPHFIAVAAPIYFIFFHPRLLGLLVREQEIQADEFAVHRLGSKAEDLIAALTKLTLASGGLIDRRPAGTWLNANAAHPTVIEREAHLQQLSGTGALSRKPDLRRRRAVATLLKTQSVRTTAALGLALALYSAYSLSTPTRERLPASTLGVSIEKRLDQLAHVDWSFPKKKGFVLRTLEDDPF